MYKHFFKRFIDIVISLCGLTVLAIPMLIVAAAIRIESKGPAIFKQKRIGLHGKVYEIYKFRSMKVNAEHTGSGVYSENELPQFINILKGEMSFIGPRPPLTYHPWPYGEYTSQQKKMFEVRPGVTGWAQINGRKNVEWNRRIEMNVWYVDNVSFVLDMKIAFRTVFKVLANKDNVCVGETVKKEEKELVTK